MAGTTLQAMQTGDVCQPIIHASRPCKPHLDVQLEQSCEAVDKHKRLALLVGVLDPEVSCQLAVSAPAKLAPRDVAEDELNHLKEQCNGCHCFVCSVCPGRPCLIRILESVPQVHECVYQQAKSVQHQVSTSSIVPARNIQLQAVGFKPVPTKICAEQTGQCSLHLHCRDASGVQTIDQRGCDSHRVGSDAWRIST